MSELKVIKAYFPTFDADHNEMLLVSHTNENYMPAKQIECYLKSEADKVIAELKADYKEACDRLQTANLIKDEQLAVTRHQKYKRCLNKAEWCEERSARYDLLQERTGFDWSREIGFYFKWHKRWLELAEKFKDVK